MKKVFHPNSRWNNSQVFITVNSSLAFVFLFALSFYVENMPLWLPVSIGLLFIIIIYLLINELLLFPVKIEVDSSYFGFYFPLNKVRKYNFDEVRLFATASYGNWRLGNFHSVIMEFNDGFRIQIPSVKIMDYNEFLRFMRTGSFKSLGFIGQNNWRQKNKPLSKKWVVERYENELVTEIGKKRSLFILYFYSILIFSMNVTMLYLLIFKL